MHGSLSDAVVQIEKMSPYVELQTNKEKFSTRVSQKLSIWSFLSSRVLTAPPQGQQDSHLGRGVHLQPVRLRMSEAPGFDQSYAFLSN